LLRRNLPNKNIEIKPLVASPSILSDAIDASYGYASSINDILKELEEGAEQVDIASLNEEDAYAHPIVRLVNALVFDAVKIGASDLHFEPEENFVRLRYRLDGVLFTAQTLHKQHWSAMSQRIKIISGMNIADKLAPQDGRFHMSVGGKMADFRVSSLPTVHGENIVLRVLDQSQSIMPLEGLGFSPENLKKIRFAQTKPEGIIIVTGPTGSGKTTSLYSMINEINTVDVNIQTLEDPVEYTLPMIRQTHVREGVLEFADGIKALLRQDPDIIFIGEIRDATTAEMALKAAMTGHQVYTTLHTNDSFGALPRLLDLEQKPGMLAGAIIAVFAQRLVRRLCVDCKVEHIPDAKECEILGVDPASPPKIFKAVQGGCKNCMGQGYKGRIAVAEILNFDDDLNELIAENRSKAEIKNAAIEKGFKSMKDDGILKVLDGITTIEALAKSVDIAGK
jgi:general secretion pathway protein E/type IV pilus assembly protein PilB